MQNITSFGVKWLTNTIWGYIILTPFGVEEIIMEKIYNTNLLNEYLKSNKISKSAFCRKCQLSDVILKKFYEHNANISVVQLFKIARQLNVSISNLYVC